MNENWKPVSWHCLNCGSIVTGYRDSKGTVKLSAASAARLCTANPWDAGTTELIFSRPAVKNE